MKILSQLNAIVWGAPALLMIIGAGIYFTLRLRLPQLRYLPGALKKFLEKMHPAGRDSSFRSVCTALGATVGTGNLVGVAGAICIGGPGAVFWMWLCGFLGMAIKYTEALLAVRYRVDGKDGCRGGPMYMITKGMGEKYRPLANAYCLCGLLASFGVGNAAQINAVTTALRQVASRFGTVERWWDLTVGILLAALVGMLLLGGAKRIADTAQTLVPLGAGAYILMCAAVLLLRRERVGEAFERILLGAFDPKSVTGGVLGSAFLTLRVGCSRGVFTNEAGMGTASIAHGAAEVSHPGEQGLMGIVEVFLDTIVICTLTALVILVSGVPIPYGTDSGAVLTAAAFSGVFGRSAEYVLTGMLVCFAIASVMGWGLYGARCCEFLFGGKGWRYFTLAQMLTAFFSAVSAAESVWMVADTLNGLMLIPNLIALAVLSPEAVRLTDEYEKHWK